MNSRLSDFWVRGWMKFAGRNRLGRVASYFASMVAPYGPGRLALANLNANGYIAPDARITHDALRLGANVFIGEKVLILQDRQGGEVTLGDRVVLHRDLTIQTGAGGSISVGARSSIHKGGQLIAYLGSISIGADVHFGPNCSFFSYNHGLEKGRLIIEQPLVTRGGIVIEDDVNLGCGVTVLDGVRIGAGAMIGAGSVVMHDIPPYAIAMGVPARVVGMRPEPAEEMPPPDEGANALSEVGP